MSQIRASCWSLTLYYDVNDKPVDVDFQLPSIPAGWTVEGQIEECPETKRLHYQGMAKTPQIRRSALDRIFGTKNHYEKAISRVGLEDYVHKPETRIAEVATKSVMNMYDFSKYIAEKFEMEEYEIMKKTADDLSYKTDGKIKADYEAVMLEYIDELVCEAIESGIEGAEWNGSNPAFRAMWKKYGLAVVKRTLRARQDRQTDTPAEA